MPSSSLDVLCVTPVTPNHLGSVAKPSSSPNKPRLLTLIEELISLLHLFCISYSLATLPVQRVPDQLSFSFSKRSSSSLSCSNLSSSSLSALISLILTSLR